MRREITIETVKPIQRIVSANVLLRTHHMRNHSRTKAQHALVVGALESKFTRCRVVIEAEGGGSKYNHFIVTLTRLWPGKLDGHDNLKLGFKALVDGIAQYIFRGKHMGRDDDNEHVEWRYAQESSPAGYYGLRVSIEDLDVGQDRVIFEGTPPAYTSVARHAPAKRSDGTEQLGLVFKRSWAAFPWRQVAEADDDLEVVEIERLATMLNTPTTFAARNPVTRQVVTMYRHSFSVPELGGDVWLYTADKPI